MIAEIPNSREKLVAEIVAAGGEYFKDAKIRCWHEGDTDPSGRIKVCTDGRLRYECFGCHFFGDEHDIHTLRTGKNFKDIMAMDNRVVNTESKPAMSGKSERATKPKKSKPMTREQVKNWLDGVGIDRTSYPYKNLDGRLVGTAVRIQLSPTEKTFRQLTPAGDGTYYPEGPDELWPVHRIRDIQPGTVVLPEGEQCADLLRDMGFNATTWAGGCGAYKNTDWAFLSGRHVIVWPDFDKSGREAAEGIRDILQAIDCTVEIIDIDLLGFTEKGSDIKDYLAAGHTADDVRRLIAQYEKVTASKRARERSLRLLNGELKAVELPWRILGHTTGITDPETVSVLAGIGGAGKSFFLMQVIRGCIERGVPVSCLMLESGKDEHIRRAVAQEAREPGWLDNGWQSDPANADTIWGIHTQHGELMDRLEDIIHDAPPFMAKVDYAIAWLTKRAQEGCRVAIIDPVTMIDYDDNREIPKGTKRLVKTSLAIAIKHEMTIILVNHYQKGNDEVMQGGASLQDHTDVVLQFTSLPETKQMKVLVPGYNGFSESAEINRIIHVKKARRGKLCWHRIGYFWDKESLTYTEKGILTKE